MLWLIREEAALEKLPDIEAAEGRFVLHRHSDEGGAHLDLRLEAGGHLGGWRIDGDALEGAAAACEKSPHPLAWLDHDGDAERIDAGRYVVLRNTPVERKILLMGETSQRLLTFIKDTSVTPRTMTRLREAADNAGCTLEALADLAADGVTARQRAIARLCGLGRELDGASFDEATTRRMLSGLRLDELHQQLRAYEVRFDQKYPPRPISQPEALDEETSGQQRALRILQTG